MFRDESEDKMQRRADILFPTMKDKKEKVTLEKEDNKKIPGLGVSKFDFDKDDDDEDITNSKKQDNKEWAEILADYVNKQKKENREDILYPTMKDKTEKHNDEDNKQDLDVKKIKINKKDIGHVTGGAADITDEYEIINGIKYPKNTNSKEIEILKEKAKKETKEIENERAKEHIKNWSGALLELGSAAIPFSSGVETVNILRKALTSKVGRKVAEEIVKQTGKGALSGGVFGLGEGLIEDKNLIKTASKDAAIGAVSGGTIGGILGKINRNIEVNSVEKILEKRKDWGIAYQKASGNPELAIETLLEKKQGFVPSAIKKKGIGEIDFVWGDSNGGLKHIIERRNKQGFDGISYVKNLPNMIKNGKVIEKTNQAGRKFIINDNTETIIRLDWNKKEAKWLVTSYYQL